MTQTDVHNYVFVTFIGCVFISAVGKQIAVKTHVVHQAVVTQLGHRSGRWLSPPPGRSGSVLEFENINRPASCTSACKKLNVWSQVLEYFGW